MTMESDVKATQLAASGDIFAGPARVKGIFYVASAVAGTIQIRDGGAGGTVICTINTPAAATETNYIHIPSAGLRCSSSAYATLTNVSFATIFWA